MSVFICWSGGRSHGVALAVQALLKSALPRIVNGFATDRVFVSDEIEKGVAWFDSIVDRLKDARAGVVCVTPESLENPWLHFEAGALAQRLGARDNLPVVRHQLFPLLYGLTGAELKGPLGAYQATSTTEAEIASMVRSIAQVVAKDERIDEGVRILEQNEWKQFKDSLDQITVSARELIPSLESLFQRKTFHEPLHRCADQAWLRRYDGARSTREQLVAHHARVRAACTPHERGLFEMLLSELDAYSMAIEALLVTQRTFKLGDDGDLEMEPGVIASCEDRRLAVKSIASRLLYPLDVPLREEAVRFMAAETNEERKMIVHRIEGAIRKEREAAFEQRVTWDDIFETLTSRELPIRYRESSWDLDRIYYYLLIQYFGTTALRWQPGVALESEPKPHDLLCAARDVEMEVERYRAKGKGGSLMPLTYALVALQELRGQAPTDSEATDIVKPALDLVQEELGSILDSEPARALARVLGDLLPPKPSP